MHQMCIRDSAKVLPEEIAFRKKLGFIVPIRIWMADDRYNQDVRAKFHHNRRLREEREQKRPIITDTKQEIALWNIWIYYQKDIMRRLAQQKGAMGGGLDDD